MLKKRNFKSNTIFAAGMATILLAGCGAGYERYVEQEYLGGTITNVYGETYIEHTGSGIGRRSYRTNDCEVTVGYEDGTSVTFVEDIEPVYCYKLSVGDWIDGWVNLKYRRNLETGETHLISETKRISIAQEISKRLN